MHFLLCAVLLHRCSGIVGIKEAAHFTKWL